MTQVISSLLRFTFTYEVDSENNVLSYQHLEVLIVPGWQLEVFSDRLQ
jgi:hypothetical protein